MITIIAGTNRSGSNSKKVALIYQSVMNEMNIDNQLLDLHDLPNDFAFAQLGTQTEDYTKTIHKYITNIDKMLIVIPEYNGGFPGVLKSFFDTVPPKYVNGMRTALVGVSSGHAGAARALDSFSDILHYLKAEVFSNKPKFSGIDGLLDESGNFKDEKTLERIKGQIEGLIAF